jgi:hypothetical protein
VTKNPPEKMPETVYCPTCHTEYKVVRVETHRRMTTNCCALAVAVRFEAASANTR